MVAALVLVLLALIYLVSQPIESQVVGPGAQAPNFSLQVVTGDGLLDRRVDLSSLRGNIAVLEFMVSWCPVCQAMAPAVVSIYDQYESKGVVFLSIAGTYNGASAESTAQFIKTYGTHWTTVLDQDNTVFKKYGVDATPTFLILDRNGQVLSRFQGMTTTSVFASGLDAALSG
jgi:peroxiredoxin